MNLSDSITAIKGIGEKSAKQFEKLNIFTVNDLIHHMPRDYEQLEQPVFINELEENRRQAVFGRVQGSVHMLRKGNLSILTFSVTDGADSGVAGNSILKITIFNMPYLAKTLKPGSCYVFYGTVSKSGKTYVMEQPRIFTRENYIEKTKRLEPIYYKTKGISNDSIIKYMKLAFAGLETVEDSFEHHEYLSHEFPNKFDALKTLHFSEDRAQIMLSRKRLAYEEFFFFILSISYLKEDIQNKKLETPYLKVANTQRLIESLPYELTKSQSQVFNEIEDEICNKNQVVNRLIQGDVGSGKTIIAILCLLLNVCNGYQGAFMAPTEVLANQHFEEVNKLIDQYNLPFKPILLTSSIPAKEKRLLKEGLEQGLYNLVIGTHALLEPDVVFANLGMVVTDEQHRFGVLQRDRLIKKGKQVHAIVMSATPIPRSLAIILYGQLQVSTINELPANRLPIKNCVVNTAFRKKAYEFIEQQVEEGRQAYVICPMVEASEMDDLENVKDYAAILKEVLKKDICVAYLHGKMKPKEKNQIMEQFALGNIHVLVSTTVIEVGINVPNATVMMVENAQRFGLATLHQLRGRVGRGNHQSYCIFVDSKNSKASKERLEILNKSNDGFYIAKEDLRIRGPGDMLGIMQSGEFSFQYADVYDDSEMLKKASTDVKNLLDDDPLLEKTQNQKIKNGMQSGNNRELHKIL